MLKTALNCIPHGLLMLALTCVVASCNKKEEPTTATPPATPVAQAPAAPSAPASPAPEAPATQPAADAGAVLAKAKSADTFVISANPELKGRLGRLVVTFPEGANANGTRVDIFKAGENSAVASGFGNQAVELLPGTYGVTITAKRVEGLPIQSGHNTKVKVGVLRVAAGASTRVDLLDADKKSVLASTFGKLEVGLPPGTVHVQIAGSSEAVTIQEGKITDF